MRKSLMGACLAVLTFATLQTPAGADLEHWFARWDYDHNNCWSWQEFRDANLDWCHRHGVKESVRDLHRRYNELARVHGGCVRMEDVRGFQRWD